MREGVLVTRVIDTRTCVDAISTWGPSTSIKTPARNERDRPQ